MKKNETLHPINEEGYIRKPGVLREKMVMSDDHPIAIKKSIGKLDLAETRDLQGTLPEDAKNMDKQK